MPPPGDGYLAGTFPDGITSILGTPEPATIRVLYRPASGALGDGVVVAEVQSAADGTWQVDGLDPALKFDVICRKTGYNDLIWADVSPTQYPPLTFSGEFSTGPTTFALQGSITVIGAVGGARVEVIGRPPPGIWFSIAGGVITASGTCYTPGDYSWSLKVTDGRHNEGTVACAAEGVASADPYASAVRALLHLDGSNGSTAFPDLYLANTWGAGGTAALTTSDSKFGGASLLLDGGGWMGTSSGPFDFGAADFTLEFWLKIAAYPASMATLAYLNGNTSTYAQLRLDLNSDGRLGVLAGTAAASWVTTDEALYKGGTVPLGAWAFLRAGRRAGNMFAEINAAQVVSYPAAVTLNNYGGPTIFGGYATGSSVAGRATALLDEIRITKGVGRSGAVPTAPFPYPST